eukprot:s2876_g4.t1
MRAGLIQAFTINGIVQVLQVHAENSAVVFYALKATVTLGYPHPPPEMIHICESLLDLVLAVMRAFPAEARIQETGCEVLSILARVEAMQEPIITKGGIALICTALKSFQADTGIQRKGCRAFANLGEFQTSREAIRREGGIELIILGMKYHVSHPEVGEQGCAAIANLALDEANRTHIAQNEGVNAVLAGLRLHQAHPGIQAFGLGALGNLATAEDNCAVILKAGAVDMVMHAMASWTDEPRVQHFACLALSNFAHDDANKVAIGRAGGNKKIISSMQRHADHAGVQEQACGALANLGVNQQNMVEIAQLSGIELVISSLKKFPTEPGVQENGCFALSKFLTMPNESYRQRMKQADAETQVHCTVPLSGHLAPDDSLHREGAWAQQRGSARSALLDPGSIKQALKALMQPSERWRAMLEIGAAQAAGHETDPQMLQISYRKHDQEEVETEIVYEDFSEQQKKATTGLKAWRHSTAMADADFSSKLFEDAAEAGEQPRLLVSLKSVSTLKLLCEHEHARCDKVSNMLAECRSAYYKELRWLREQLYLAYESEEDAAARRNLLTPDDFEVYWFEPEKFLDEDTRDFLIRCVRETNRRLLDENRQLKSTLQDYLASCALEEASLLKRLKLKHAAAQIMVELYNLLRTRAEMKKFKEAACDLIGMAMPPESQPTAATAAGVTEAGSQEDGAAASGSVDAAGDELADLRSQAQRQEAELLELRSKLSGAIDARLEQEKAQRAAEERERAEERAGQLQRRVSELEREKETLAAELRETRELEPELERMKNRMVRSVHKISESLQTLGPGAGEDEARNARRALSTDDLWDWEQDETDSVAGSFRAALSRLDSLVIALPSTVQDVAVEMQQLKQRCDELETNSMAPTADPEEHGRGAAMVRDLATKLDLANEKIRLLQDGCPEQLLKLGQKHGLPEEGLLGEKGLEEVPDFLLPYQLLAKRKVAGIFVLQDAELKRKKRAYLEKAENRTVGKEVFAAFDFLVTAAAAQPQAPQTGSRLPSPSHAPEAETRLAGGHIQLPSQMQRTRVAVGSRLQSPPRQKSLGVPNSPRRVGDLPSRSASPERSPLQQEPSRQPGGAAPRRASATVCPCSDTADFQGYTPGCVQGNAIFSAANVAGFTSPKESSQLQQLQNAPKGAAGAFLMDSPATPHFPPTGAKTDTNFYRARPTSKDTRHITSANDDRSSPADGQAPAGKCSVPTRRCENTAAAERLAALEVIKNSKPSFDVKICCNVLLRRLGEEAKAGAPPGQASAGWTGPPPGTEWAHREWALPAWEARPWGWECLGSRSCKHRFNGRRVLCHLGKCLSAQAAPARRECLARAPCQAKECHQVPGQKECLARAPKATGRCRTPPELCFGQSVARTMALISDNDCLDNRVACPGPSVLAEVALTGPVCTGHGRLTKTTS